VSHMRPTGGPGRESQAADVMQSADDLARLVIAIDGTAGSGKSSASRGVALRLGLRYLDTGAMYRAMTWQMLIDRVPVDDEAAVASRAESVVIGSGTNPELPTISLNGVDVSVEIRSDEVTSAVSAVSAVQRVRELLVAQQRSIIGTGAIVVEGRDIGTVVAPDAALKVYLSADPAARARRRAAELHESQQRDLSVVEEALRRRDGYDSSRATAPLAAASDAVVIDSTDLGLDDVIDEIVALALDRIRAAD
jgi:CMP/dCMP kinase